MAHRTLVLAGSIALAGAIAGASIISGPLEAQSRSASAKPYTVPRTPDGRPDLQGIYNVETITPVERPIGVKSLVLTDQEAGALEEYERQRNAKSLEPSRGDRSAPPVGGENAGPPKSFLEFLERAGGGAVGGYNNFWLAAGTKFITVDGQKRSSIIVDPPDGRMPPMKPEARKRNADYLRTRVSPDAAEASSAAAPAGAFDGPEVRPLAERCLLGFLSTSGPPTLPNYFYNNLKQIVQSRDTIMILNEMVHDVRFIRMNATHLPQSLRNWLGDSIGRWEGDTLVVETTNFTDKTQFNGSGKDLKVTERFTRVDDTTLLYRFTVEDPSTWDRPWSGEYPWVASSEPLYEYACHEGNYSLASILKGARLDEADAARKR